MPPRPACRGRVFLIVEARYYESVAALLFEGAKAAFEAAGATFEVVRVTGALEIPAGLAIALELASADGRPYDGAIALGCVIRGETYHFEIVAGESARALMTWRFRAGWRSATASSPSNRSTRAKSGLIRSAATRAATRRARR